ncbi:hypothetical protein BKA63DRAFT_418810 [Paraphoma chrysanthemicola]|nr:hypothetical protein BKA63DRAFT_418810 [Paraphoma chrysanthemicola]
MYERTVGGRALRERTYKHRAGRMSADGSDKQQARTPSPALEAHTGGDSIKDNGDDAPPVQKAAAAAAPDRMATAITGAEVPLPYEDAPPLPDEPPPDQEDDGWQAKWDESAHAYYFYNSRTGVSQWDNPRVPAATTNTHGSYDRTPFSGATLPSTAGAPGTSSPPKRKWGGYNPAIHGSYDPNADYARAAEEEEDEGEDSPAAVPGLPGVGTPGYVAQAHFNRFTGKFQQADAGPELHNDENKSKRQMTAFFDVDAAANSHDGRSLKAERRGKTLSKKELKAFKEKRHSKKEEKRRAWLRD